MKKNKIGGNQNRYGYKYSGNISEDSAQRTYSRAVFSLYILFNKNRIGTYYNEDLQSMESFYKVKINP